MLRVHQPEPGSFDLALARSSLQLAQDFDGLDQRRRARGMTQAETTAAGVDDDLTTVGRAAVLEGGAGISVSIKAETRAANAGTSHSTITGTIMLLTSSVRSGSGQPPTVGSNRYKSTVISG